MRRHVLAEITLTIVTTFGCYVVANNLFGCSGVLAVVFLGADPGVHMLQAVQ